MLHFNSLLPIPLHEIQLSPFTSAAKPFDPTVSPSLFAAQARLFSIKDRERRDREYRQVEKKLAFYDAQRVAFNARDGVRKSGGATTQMRSGSLSEAKAILRNLKNRANALPKLKTGSLAEAQSVMDKIHERDALCDRALRKGEVRRAKATFSQFGLPVSLR
jgi:hypothetical protein